MIKRFLGLVLVLCSITVLSFGQAVSVNGGAIQGSITDASGAVVPNASVVIKATDTGSIRDIKTDASGYYSVGPLNPGNYSITISAGGFQRLSVNTVVKTGTVTAGSYSLSIGQSNVTVEVNAGAVQVNTDQAGVSDVISREQIESLPINGRNVLKIRRSALVQLGVVKQ